jgi:hypothetical protein
MFIPGLAGGKRCIRFGGGTLRKFALGGANGGLFKPEVAGGLVICGFEVASEINTKVTLVLTGGQRG